MTPEMSPPARRGRAGGLIVGVALVALAIAAVAWALSRDEDATPGASGTTPRSSAAGACAQTSLRPTYLPWLEPGEDVPEPVERQGVISWFDGPAAEPGTPSVVLAAAAEPPLGEVPDAEQVAVRGATGTLIWIGDPGVGQLSLTWQEEEGECGLLALYVLLPDLSEAATKTEILKVAESLG